MKALVMGGTEFVSSSFAKYLIDKEYEVDIFTRGIRSVNYEGVRKHLKGDRSSVADLQNCIGKESYDFIFDFSAYTKEDVHKLISVVNRDDLKRYVFCSSGAVYIPCDRIILEDYFRGENINWGSYGLDKKQAEDYLFQLYEEEKFPMTIFRPTYIYGEGNNLYRECYFFDRIIKGLDIPIPKDGKTTQFIHISDLVKAFESAIHIDKTLGQAYNITHPEVVTWTQLVETIMRVMNKEVNIKEVEDNRTNISTREYFPFRNVNYLLNVEKSKEHGIHMPQIDMFEGMNLAYKWYRDVSPKLMDSKMNKVDFVLNI